jgi:homoserine dehydrogenase
MGVAQTITRRSEDLWGHDIGIDVVAVVDSRSAAVSNNGLDLRSVVAEKKSTGKVGQIEMGAMEVIEKVESDAVVEVTPANPEGGEPALSHIRAALKGSKHVVTANKMPLAVHYGDLIDEAAAKGVRILYGACVGGGLPILEMGKMLAEVEPVQKIEGVVNATTNFILTKMGEERTTYAAALAEAQRLGFAETDPTLDINGFDAACKLVILANHVMGTKLTLEQVDYHGIEGVTPQSLGEAAVRGKAVKLLARTDDRPKVSVMEVDAKSPLNIAGPSHAVVFHCRDSGERAITGKGAGPLTTSGAVLRDLMTLAAVQRLAGKRGIKTR